LTRAKHGPEQLGAGWSDRHGSGGNEVGSLQPSRVFCRVQNQPLCQAQPSCFSQVPFPAAVNGAVNRVVITIFHAPFTLRSMFPKACATKLGRLTAGIESRILEICFAV